LVCVGDNSSPPPREHPPARRCLAADAPHGGEPSLGGTTDSGDAGITKSQHRPKADSAPHDRLPRSTRQHTRGRGTPPRVTHKRSGQPFCRDCVSSHSAHLAAARHPRRQGQACKNNNTTADHVSRQPRAIAEHPTVAVCCDTSQRRRRRHSRPSSRPGVGVGCSRAHDTMRSGCHASTPTQGLSTHTTQHTQPAHAHPSFAVMCKHAHRSVGLACSQPASPVCGRDHVGGGGW
jgi:hypothetical protein